MNAKYILLGVVVVGLFFLVWWLIKDEFFAERRLPTHSIQPVPGKVEFFYDKLLLVRRESAGGPLLLKVLNENLIVRYRFDTQRVERVQPADWHAAAGKVKICGQSFGVSEEDEIGKYNTYGKYARLAAYTREKDELAIISAAGPKLPGFSLIPFLGGGPVIHGSRYLEVKDGAPPYSNVRGPVRVVEDSGMGLCWSEEEDVLVYFSTHTYFFSILDVGGASSNSDLSDQPARPVPADPKPDLSRLTGNFRDTGVDEDGDGLFEKVVIEMETETSISGRYKIFLGLNTSAGTYLTGQAEADLKGGVETIPVIFDTKDWYDKGIEGHLDITAAHLDYVDGPNLEIRERVGRTQNYSRDLFKRKNIIYTGAHDVQAVDPDRDGRFRGLEFTVEVDVLQPGDYAWSGDLYFEKWSSTTDGMIKFLEGRAKFKKGKNLLKLRFDAKSILKYGKAGRFELRNVLIYRAGEKGTRLESLPLTRPFQLSEFTND